LFFVPQNTAPRMFYVFYASCVRVAFANEPEKLVTEVQSFLEVWIFSNSTFSGIFRCDDLDQTHLHNWSAMHHHNCV